MPKVQIELTKALWDAIDAERGSLSRGEFIETGMQAHMSKGKLKLNTEMLKKQWSP